MGVCCSQKKEVKMINPTPDVFLRNRRATLTLTKNEIFQFMEEISQKVEENFLSSVDQKISEQNPFSVAQLDKILRQQYEKIQKEFSKSFLDSDKGNSIPYNDVMRALKNLLMRCKANQIYYRYMNDKHSFKYLTRLKEFLIRELLIKQYSSQQVIKQFQLRIRGSFAMQGLQEIHDLISELPQGPEAVIALLQSQHSQTFKSLQELYQDYRNSFPVSFYEFPSTADISLDQGLENLDLLIPPNHFALQEFRTPSSRASCTKNNKKELKIEV